MSDPVSLTWHRHTGTGADRFGAVVALALDVIESRDAARWRRFCAVYRSDLTAEALAEIGRAWDEIRGGAS